MVQFFFLGPGVLIANRTRTQQTGLQLHISPVRPDDQAVYECRSSSAATSSPQAPETVVFSSIRLDVWRKYQRTQLRCRMGGGSGGLIL